MIFRKQKQEPTERELRERANAARQEWPATADAFARVREAAASKIFDTLPSETAKREEIYRIVHIIDAVETELLGAMALGQEEIDKYAASLADTPR